LLVLGFESTDHPVDQLMMRALELCDEHGGWVGQRRGMGGGGASSAGRRATDADVDSADKNAGALVTWRDAFLGAPYLRDVFIAMGVLSETFETAITWERFPAFHQRVMAATERVTREVAGTDAVHVSCRLTHIYPNGPAPYFTVVAPARRGAEVEQWGAIKRAVSDEILAAGGTITHHHAVGRDHRPWYDLQRPEPFAAALRGAKSAVDPGGIMNPGVLVDPLIATDSVTGPANISLPSDPAAAAGSTHAASSGAASPGPDSSPAAADTVTSSAGSLVDPPASSLAPS
jgi:alkyldihydroxyacetonephosphate synthase